MDPPKLAPHIAPKPAMAFCMAWYIPRLRKGIISEFTIVAEETVRISCGTGGYIGCALKISKHGTFARGASMPYEQEIEEIGYGRTHGHQPCSA